MANEALNPGGKVPNIRVLAQYTKALSFVTADGVQLSEIAGSPSIDLGVDLTNDVVPGQQKVFETTLKLMGRAHTNDQTIFEVDLAYSGVFDLAGSPDDIVEPVLMIDCPNLLFPYARRIITDVTREGGFPPLMVDPIDFSRLYREQLAKNAGQS